MSNWEKANLLPASVHCLVMDGLIEHRLIEIVRFSACHGPRCRACLRMHLGRAVGVAATGGILQAWPGMPDGFAVTQVRLFLEAWGAAMSGNPVEFRPFPDIRTILADDRAP